MFSYEALILAILYKFTACRLITIFFVLAKAFLVYKILKINYTRGPVALLCAAGFLLLPTVLLNSAFWGQSDAIYTCFLLACVYFLMRDRPLPAMFFLGVSFAFKA